MMKNNKGITLTILVVTIVVLTILTGVVVNYSYDGMNNVRNDKFTTQLGVVRQAVVEQYEQAVTVGKNNVSMSEDQVSYWVGERIDDFSQIELPEKTEISLTDNAEKFYNRESTYNNLQYQEDYYYRLTPDDLQQIGISNSKYTFVVNYSTGEVYNETKKVNKDLELLYLPSIKYDTDTNDTGDKESFNDWT